MNVKLKKYLFIVWRSLVVLVGFVIAITFLVIIAKWFKNFVVFIWEAV